MCKNTIWNGENTENTNMSVPGLEKNQTFLDWYLIIIKPIKKVKVLMSPNFRICKSNCWESGYIRGPDFIIIKASYPRNPPTDSCYMDRVPFGQVPWGARKGSAFTLWLVGSWSGQVKGHAFSCGGAHWCSGISPSALVGSFTRELYFFGLFDLPSSFDDIRTYPLISADITTLLTYIRGS